jgi:hypothetical protein
MIQDDLGGIGKTIADEFKPLTPIVGNSIPAPMPQQYPNAPKIIKPVIKNNNSPQLSGSKFWSDDLKFWS